jgi:hypothetical protein
MFLFIIGLLIILFVFKKEDKFLNLKILKFIVFSILSFFVFYFLLYLCGKTNPYQIGYNDYWIYNPPLLFSFKIYLYVLVLALLSYVLTIENRRILKCSVCIIFCLYLCVNIFKYGRNIEFWNIENKQTIYMTDKIAVFYLKQGKTAIVPVDDIHVIVPVLKWFFPEEITNNTYRGKVFYKDKCWPYFLYLSKVYNVDTTPGMMFLPTEEALEEFRKNGGVLTNLEMQKLKFSIIERQIVKKND